MNLKWWRSSVSWRIQYPNDGEANIPIVADLTEQTNRSRFVASRVNLGVLYKVSRDRSYNTCRVLGSLRN